MGLMESPYSIQFVEIRNSKVTDPLQKYLYEEKNHHALANTIIYLFQLIFVFKDILYEMKVTYCPNKHFMSLLGCLNITFTHDIYSCGVQMGGIICE